MKPPVVTTACADCGVGTISIGECFMVEDRVWERAWAGRRRAWHGNVPGQEILCVGCLEARIGRRLTARDFACDIGPSFSERLRDRLKSHGAGAALRRAQT
jgi:hypothetical protein